MWCSGWDLGTVKGYERKLEKSKQNIQISRDVSIFVHQS